LGLWYTTLLAWSIFGKFILGRTPVKHLKPLKGELVMVRDPSPVVDGKVMVNLVIGDGEHIIEELWIEPVSSVNGKTGAVTLTPSDLGLGNVLSDINTIKAQLAALMNKTLYAKLGS
jgi:hypothetical protein